MLSSRKTKRGICFPLFFILCSLIFVSCKEKNIDIRFSGEGKFSHKALVKMIDEPETFQDETSKTEMPADANTDFYGIDKEEMGKIIKSFGDCEGNGTTVFSAEMNGLAIKKIYIKKGTEFFFNFSSENVLHEKIHETAQKMYEENPALVVKYAENKKSFSVYCKFTQDYIMFDSDETGEEIKLADFKNSGGKQDKMKVKIKDGKVTIIGDDKELGAYIKFEIEKVKGI